MGTKEIPYLAVGDTVEIDFKSPQDDEPWKRKFEARIKAIKERPPSAPLIIYERLDGRSTMVGKVVLNEPACDASWVTRVIERYPYRPKIRLLANVFADGAPWASWPKKGNPGERVGPFESLVCDALSKVTHIELEYSFHATRARELYLKDQQPGRTGSIDMENIGLMTVRWKVFKKWVRANAQRLIMSKREYLSMVIDERKRQHEEDMRTVLADMDYLDEVVERDNHYVPQEVDNDRYYEP